MCRLPGLSQRYIGVTLVQHVGNQMIDKSLPILVFGATGQQGGSVVTALLRRGWSVRALVRDPSSTKARSLADAGVDLKVGTFGDAPSIKAAMTGAYGVFSVQPSSPGGAVTDEEEVRYGMTIANLAVEAGVGHLVYTSGGAVRDEPSGVAHFDTKSQIEKHIRALAIRSTIVRPATFMELMTMPGFGLNEGRFEFFMRDDQKMQLIAVDDIGKIVAEVFEDPENFGGETFEIAGDAVTGRDLQKLFSRAAGRQIPYARFSTTRLSESPFLTKLTEMMDEGRLAGGANLALMRKLNPELQTFEGWLSGPGRASFEQALSSADRWGFDT